MAALSRCVAAVRHRVFERGQGSTSAAVPLRTMPTPSAWVGRMLPLPSGCLPFRQNPSTVSPVADCRRTDRPARTDRLARAGWSINLPG